MILDEFELVDMHKSYEEREWTRLERERAPIEPKSQEANFTILYTFIFILIVIAWILVIITTKD